MRATDLHAAALAARQSRREEWIATIVMLAAFLAGLFVVECIAISLLDWIEGRPHSVWPAIVAFLDVIDGGAQP